MAAWVRLRETWITSLGVEKMERREWNEEEMMIDK